MPPLALTRAALGPAAPQPACNWPLDSAGAPCTTAAARGAAAGAPCNEGHAARGIWNAAARASADRDWLRLPRRRPRRAAAASRHALPRALPARGAGLPGRPLSRSAHRPRRRTASGRARNGDSGTGGAGRGAGGAGCSRLGAAGPRLAAMRTPPPAHSGARAGPPRRPDPLPLPYPAAAAHRPRAKPI